jgi:hypothetical protein
MKKELKRFEGRNLVDGIRSAFSFNQPVIITDVRMHIYGGTTAVNFQYGIDGVDDAVIIPLSFVGVQQFHWKDWNVCCQELELLIDNASNDCVGLVFISWIPLSTEKKFSSQQR